MKGDKAVFFLIVLMTLLAVAFAQLLHPIEHITGRWYVNLRRKDKKLLDMMVFPAQSCSVPWNEEGMGKMGITLTSTPRRSKSLKCELVLEADGTFTLNPPKEDSKLYTGRDDGMSSKINRMPLKGHWKLHPNPYCVTDRQYDELTLISNPKVRCNNHKFRSTSESSLIKEKVTLEMHCRVRGRFSSNTIRAFMKLPRAKDAGRLTHGTLTIRKDTIIDEHSPLKDEIVQRTRRAICATFHARTTCRATKMKRNKYQ